MSLGFVVFPLAMKAFAARAHRDDGRARVAGQIDLGDDLDVPGLCVP